MTSLSPLLPAFSSILSQLPISRSSGSRTMCPGLSFGSASAYPVHPSPGHDFSRSFTRESVKGWSSCQPQGDTSGSRKTICWKSWRIKSRMLGISMRIYHISSYIYDTSGLIDRLLVSCCMQLLRSPTHRPPCSCSPGACASVRFDATCYLVAIHTYIIYIFIIYNIRLRA